MSELKTIDLIGIIENSELFHSKYKLPIIPQHNNPHFYGPVIWKCVTSQGLEIPERWIEADNAFMFGCMRTRSDGVEYFVIYPDGSGGEFSHDEAEGRAASSRVGARFLLDGLEFWDWKYPKKDGDLEAARWFARFVFLRPFLRARAKEGAVLSEASQLAWAAHVTNSAITDRADNFDPDGLLRIWIMIDEMKRYELCAPAIALWLNAMDDREIGPRKIFTSHYLNECPTMRIIAPISFRGGIHGFKK